MGDGTGITIAEAFKKNTTLQTLALLEMCDGTGIAIAAASFWHGFS